MYKTAIFNQNNALFTIVKQHLNKSPQCSGYQSIAGTQTTLGSPDKKKTQQHCFTSLSQERSINHSNALLPAVLNSRLRGISNQVLWVSGALWVLFWVHRCILYGSHLQTIVAPCLNCLHQLLPMEFAFSSSTPKPR